MTTVIRRKRTSRSAIGPYRRHELLTGRIEYPVQGYTGYGDGVGTDLTAFISDTMRRDWQNHREALLAFWRSGKSDAEVFPDDAPVVVHGWQCRHAPVGGEASGLPQQISSISAVARSPTNSRPSKDPNRNGAQRNDAMGHERTLHASMCVIMAAACRARSLPPSDRLCRSPR